MGDLGLESFQRFLLFKEGEICQCCGAGRRVGRVAVSVLEGFLFRMGAEKSVVDFLRDQRRGKGKDAAGQPLGTTEQIGNNFLTLAGEHGARPAECGHDFIEDQQRSGPIAVRAEFPEHSRGPWLHAGHSLDDRLNDDGGQFLRPGEGAELLHVRKALDGKVHAREAVKERGDAAEARGARGIAMVGIGETCEAPPEGISALLPVLDRHLEGGFDGGGSVVGEEDAGKGGAGKKPRKPDSQADSRGMGGAQKGGVVERGKLTGDGLDDSRVGVSVDIGPD